MLSHKLDMALSPAQNGEAISADALDLAERLRQAMNADPKSAISQAALQTLLATLCRAYALQTEDGMSYLPASVESGLTATEVMLAASGLLRSANLAVFELGMWQSWSGR